jgi:Fic family protein
MNLGWAGHFVAQPTGYQAFVPAPFPPDDLIVDPVRSRLISETHAAIGRLVGASAFVPNPDLFVAVYVRREAIVSSQIEGTQASLDELFQFEIDPSGVQRPRDLEEVVQYVKAYDYARHRLATLPLSIRLLKETHEVLLSSGRGRNRQPGEIRTSQNWVGGPTVMTARYVPPPEHNMWQALDQWEKFVHDNAWDPLVQTALIHAQFETIHPFLDGNGRLGRLLIPLLLQEKDILERDRALLYPSHYLKLNQEHYYDRLQAIRERGDWEGWLDFFLEGLRQVAVEAYLTIREIAELRVSHQAQLTGSGRGAGTLLRALDALTVRPVASAASLAVELGVSEVTSNAVIRKLLANGILDQVGRNKRNRLFRYRPYLDLFSDEAFERRIGGPDQRYVSGVVDLAVGQPTPFDPE